MGEILAGNELYVFAVLTFVAILLAMESAYLWWRSRHGVQARKLRQRLDTVPAATSPASVLKERLISELPLLERKFREMHRVQRIERYIEQSGLRWTVAQLLFGSLLAAAFTGLIARENLRLDLIPSIGFALFAGAAPLLYLRWRREKRLVRIETQLPDALDLMTRALRAGHAFTACLKMVSEEMLDPIAGEFRTIHDEVNYGVSLPQALANFSDRVPLTDLRYFTVAVLIQRDSGGNLTEVLSNLARLVRERAKLSAKVRVLSAEGRMSAWIMAGLPFFLGGALYLLNPKFMGPMFTDPMGQTILTYLLVMMGIGIVVLQRIVRIRY